MERNERYFRLNSALSALSTRDLGRLLDANKTKEGWGTSHVFSVASCQVFAKKIPLTRLEYENGFSTRNLFKLPTYYNYGVGSAGFGAYRELLTHIKKNPTSTSCVDTKAPSRLATLSSHI